MINNILSYVQCARQSGSTTEVIQAASYFYEYEEICKAKEIINLVVGEPVKQCRKPTIRAKSAAELEDILNAFSIAEQKEIVLPTYTAYGVKALPPADGFQFFKDTLDVMMEEIRELKKEVESLKKQRETEDSNIVLKSLNDLKISLTKDIKAIRSPVIENASPVNSGPEEHTGPKENLISENLISGFISSSRQKQNNAASADKQPTIWPMVSNSDVNSWPWIRDPPMRKTSEATRPKVKAPQKSEVKNLNGGEKSLASKSRNRDQAVQDNGGPTRRKQDVVRGNRKPGETGAFIGAERQADLYVGGCNKQVKIADIEEYCKNVLNVNLVKCDELLTKSTRFKSFKLCLDRKDRDNLLVSDSWPIGTVVRKFTKPRGVSMNNFSSKTSDVGNNDQEKYHDALSK